MKKYIVKVFKNLNKSLFFWTMLYAIGGAFLILDASLISATLTYGYDNPYHFFIAQLAFIVVSLIGAYIIIKFIPTKIYGIASIFIGGILIVALVGAFGGKWIGNGVRAVTLQIGGFTLQPAEFLKIALIMFMGSFYYYRSKNPKLKSWWWLALIPSVTVFAIVMFGGDFGTAAIIAALSALIFVAVPTSKEEVWFNRIKKFAIIGLVGSVLALKLGYLVIPEEKLKSDYRLNRFIYTNPCDRYEENSGYQVCNGFIAIDNGGLKGVGIGNSVQKYLYLPASHTDFIFPIVVEELGSIVGVLIIVGFMYIIALIFRVASSSYNLQNSIICYGIGINLMLHIFVNLGGVLGIIPLTGVPLPFLSYGGSFTICLIAALTIVQRVSIENGLNREKEIC